MNLSIRSLVRAWPIVLLAWCVASPAWAGDAMLLRVFLADGTALVSYGEFARVDDRVVLSLPVGGSLEQPRLHLVSIPAGAIDWPRTDRYGASARYQHYAMTAGEEDFIGLSNYVARVLNEIAVTTEPARALQMATQARTAMAEWPAAHYGYRQREVTEIVGLLDEAISTLRAQAGVGAFDLALVATVKDVDLEPLLGMPAPRELLAGILAGSRLTSRAAERISLLESALLFIDEQGARIPSQEAAGLRTSIRAQIHEEQTIDLRYARIAARLMSAAQRAAAGARISRVEAVLARVPLEDERLGRRRPDVVQALQASLQSHLDSARKLRLLQDQWRLRRALYQDYQRLVGSQILQLVKSQPALDAIRRLDGPAPDALSRLHNRLAGGAEQLQRLLPPRDLRPAHDLLVGAWRFAEQAIQARQTAVGSANVGTAWEASSAAAAALMLLSNAQRELQSFVAPPQLKP